MELLPTEIKIKIFTSLPALPDVWSLNRTSTSFHKTFVGAKTFIIQKWVKNGLDPKLLREVLALGRSIQISVWSREAVLEILDTYFSVQPTIKTIMWDMSTAMKIHQLQTLVECFAAEFAADARGRDSLTDDDSSLKSAPTTSELRRFQRNFWKFELYCNLFRKITPRNRRIRQHRFSTDEQKSIFFDHFTAFENEQLGCVHDYLWDQVSCAFDEVAAHDVKWGGKWQVDWVSDYWTGEAGWKEALLSRGLAQIMAMKNARDYAVQYDLVQGQGSRPDFDGEFLAEGLMRTSLDDNDCFKEPEDLTLEQIRESSISPLSPEPDDGPYEAWKWLFGHKYISRYFLGETWFLRQRAYVMWDSDRMALWSILKDQRADIFQKFQYAYQPSLDAISKQNQSYEERSVIYEEGGRGWWDFNDHSRIEWPVTRSKNRLKRKRSACLTASSFDIEGVSKRKLTRSISYLPSSEEGF